MRDESRSSSNDVTFIGVSYALLHRANYLSQFSLSVLYKGFKPRRREEELLRDPAHAWKFRSSRIAQPSQLSTRSHTHEIEDRSNERPGD